MVVRFYVVFLAAACVDNQAEGKGKISAAGEERYGLRHAVFEDLEIILGQVTG